MTVTMFDSPEPALANGGSNDGGVFGRSSTFERLQARRRSRTPYLIAAAALAAGVGAFAATMLGGGPDETVASPPAGSAPAPISVPAPITSMPAVEAAAPVAAPVAAPAAATPAPRVERTPARTRPASTEAAPAVSAAQAPTVAATPLIVAPPPAEANPATVPAPPISAPALP